MELYSLDQIPLFANLPDDEKLSLIKAMHPISLATGDVLCQEGERGDRFYIILEGELEVKKAMGEEEEKILNVRQAGEFVGEMSLFDRHGLRTATICALSPANLLEMTLADFDALLRRQPTLAYEVMRQLSLRLQNSDNAVIRDLQQKNMQLAQAYRELQAAQAQIIEKETLERELQLARKIQESILPRAVPRLAGFDFRAHMLPARAVGGDVFDLISFNKDAVGVFIGDVSDKGVPAAIFMALVRSLFRAEAQANRPPQVVLQKVNHHLLEMNDAGMFVTVLYGVLNRQRREFHYARAGHEIPWLFDSSGQIQIPTWGTGQPLGVFPRPKLDQNCITIQPGSTLALYTDGASDAQNEAGDAFGQQRLQDALRASLGQPVTAALHQVFGEIKAFQGNRPQFDDITMVMVRGFE